jgi:stage II sporulation protein D
MRRLLPFSLALALTLVLAATASAQAVFVFRGHGWGHGVGMGQWGAYGFAKNGWTYDRILAHYYRGTTLGQAPVERIRVLLSSGLSTVEISSPAPFALVHGGGRLDLPAGTVSLGPDLTLTVDGKARSLRSPVRFEPGREPLRFGRAYRGALVVFLVDGVLSVVNDVRLEHYVYAIVPHEMPASWDMEALKAQAVAARTFAIASMGQRSSESYDFEHNPIAQAYEGIEEEDPRTSAAVDATAGQILLYEGKPVWTFYSSSSGGRTAALSEAYQGGEDLPYLAPVEDPYDTLSPNHDWEVRFTDAELAARLGLPGPPKRLKTVPGPSGRALALIARGPGWRKEIPGPSLRSSLGLRSTLFVVVKERGAPARAARAA